MLIETNILNQKNVYSVKNRNSRVEQPPHEAKEKQRRIQGQMRAKTSLLVWDKTHAATSKKTEEFKAKQQA